MELKALRSDAEVCPEQARIHLTTAKDVMILLCHKPFGAPTINLGRLNIPEAGLSTLGLLSFTSVIHAASNRTGWSMSVREAIRRTFQ